MKKETSVDSVFDVLPYNCAGQNLKKEVAADIRMHTVVLISATLTHTGMASKSNQGEERQQKLIMQSFFVVIPLNFFLSADRNWRVESLLGAARVLVEDQRCYFFLFLLYSIPLQLLHHASLKMRGRLHILTPCMTRREKT